MHDVRTNPLHRHRHTGGIRGLLQLSASDLKVTENLRASHIDKGVSFGLSRHAILHEFTGLHAAKCLEILLHLLGFDLG